MGILDRTEEEVRRPSASAEQGLSEKDIEQQGEPTPQYGLHTAPRLDRELEKRVVRKTDLHLIPLVMVLCGWQI